MRVLIVDPSTEDADSVEHMLSQVGYRQLLSTRDPTGVAHLCATWRPDLVLLELHMPGLSGYQVMAAIRQRMLEPEELPVVVISAERTTEARHRALSMGARDFVTKPIDQGDLLLRVRNVLQTRHLQQQLQHRNTVLEQAVREGSNELQQARRESLTILAALGEYHDQDTHQHTERVGALAAFIARNLQLPQSFIANIRDAAPLHDIGKVAISRQILRKPGPLSGDERASVMCHVQIGWEILSGARSPVLRLAAEIARSHHERWDGKGYLEGLAGENIPLSARITAVADVFDALTHERPYKPAWDVERAATEIDSQAGRQFDPRVVAAFMALDPQLLADVVAQNGCETRGLTQHRFRAMHHRALHSIPRWSASRNDARSLVPARWEPVKPGETLRV